MKKFLIVAHYSRFLVQFEMNNVHILQNMGYEVHYATNYENEDMYADAPERIRNEGVLLHQIDFVRSPYNVLANVKAYNQLVQLMEKEQFAGVHCHTPMAGVLARMAANKTNTKPVLYTAHGFHFYKGCPIQNTLIYKTAEWYFSRYTDVLITINEEDYQAAKRFPLRGNAYKIPGVGVDVDKIQNLKIDRTKKRQELGIPENAFLMVSVGELIERKNHSEEIKAFKEANLENAYLLIVGSGRLYDTLLNQIKELQLENKVKLLGFRSDVAEIMHCCDVFIFASKQEGLGLVGIEAMATGLPLVTTNIRGISEYSKDGITGYTYTCGKYLELAEKMKMMYNNSSYINKKFSLYNLKLALKFNCESSRKMMNQIYDNMLFS